MFPQTQHKILIKRLLGSKVFLFLVALALIWLTLGVGRESYRKYQLTKEINTLKSEIARLEGTNQQLANLIEYFQ
jgi:cell division protein FtsL